MYLNMRKVLISMFFVAASFVACDDDEKTEEKQGVDMFGFMLQEGSGAKSTFTPYFYFTPNTPDKWTFKSFELVPDEDVTPIEIERVSEYLYRTTGNQHLSSVMGINGIHCMDVKSEDDEWKSLTRFSYDSKSDTIGVITLKSLYYKDNKIIAAVFPVANAYEIGFAFIPYADGETPSLHSIDFSPVVYNPASSKDGMQFTYSLKSDDLKVDNVDVMFYAASYNSVYRLSEKRILKKGAKDFIY